MQHSPDMNPVLRERSLSDADQRQQRTADRVYQCLTLAAMLWALASLWVF
jgi:hypothetical protein